MWCQLPLLNGLRRQGRNQRASASPPSCRSRSRKGFRRWRQRWSRSPWWCRCLARNQDLRRFRCDHPMCRSSMCRRRPGPLLAGRISPRRPVARNSISRLPSEQRTVAKPGIALQVAMVSERRAPGGRSPCPAHCGRWAPSMFLAGICPHSIRSIRTVSSPSAGGGGIDPARRKERREPTDDSSHGFAVRRGGRRSSRHEQMKTCPPHAPWRAAVTQRQGIHGAETRAGTDRADDPHARIPRARPHESRDHVACTLNRLDCRKKVAVHGVSSYPVCVSGRFTGN